MVKGEDEKKKKKQVSRKYFSDQIMVFILL